MSPLAHLLSLLVLLLSQVGALCRQIAATDSDYLYLSISNTTLPGVSSGPRNRGVFARHAIKAQAIVCEYRGPVIKSEDKGSLDDTYSFGTTGPDGEDMLILGEGICPLVNDCVAVLNNPLLTSNLVQAWAAQGTNVTANDVVPPEMACAEGRDHNLKAVSNNAKVFYVTTRDVSAGEELFVFYGQRYWLSFLVRQAQGSPEQEPYSRVEL